MRAWLMNISLVDGWFPATLFSVTAVLAAILLGAAIWETVAGSRDGGKRTFAVVVCPVVIAIIAGIAGLVIAWLLSDVFVVFGVELGPHVVAWAGCGCAIIGFAICYAVQHRGVLRAVAVVLTVFAVLSAATGIDQAYGEYATIGSLFGQDTYREADLTGMAKRSDLISVTQWKQEKADGSVSNIPAHGEVRKVNIPATASHFEARKALVYLPPAALATAKHKSALPVILMMSGQPGSPGRVFAAGGIQTMMDDYAQHHGGLAPIVIAADQLGDDSHNTLCVDSPVYGNALTYLTKDVVNWVKANLPAAQQAQDWAIAGFHRGPHVRCKSVRTIRICSAPSSPPAASSNRPMAVKASMNQPGFFHGDRTAYEKQIPINAIRNHAPSNQTLVIGAGERDRESVRNVERIAPVAQQAGMRVTAVESLGNAHDWHAVQDTLRYGLAVFGCNTGLSDAKPKLVDYPNLKRIAT